MPTELEVKIAVAIHALGLVRWNGARHLTVTNQFVAASVLQNHLAVITRGVTARMLLRPKHNRHTKHTRREQEEPQHKRGTKQHKIEHQEFPRARDFAPAAEQQQQCTAANRHQPHAAVERGLTDHSIGTTVPYKQVTKKRKDNN
jgi:hypothetical protein